MTSPLDAERESYQRLQQILERQHRRPFSYDEARCIGQGLTELVTILAQALAQQLEKGKKK